MIQYWIMLICSLSLFMMIIVRNSIRDGMKFYSLCQRFHPMISWKVCTNWRYVSPCSSKSYWNCTTWRFIRRCRCPMYQKLTTMVKRSIDQKLRLRNFEVRHGKIESGAVVKSRKRRIGTEGGKGSLLSSGKKKASVRKESDAVSGTELKTVHKNQNTLSPRLLSQPLHKVEVCRGCEVSEAKVTMGPFFDNRAYIIWKVLARDRLVNIGMLPSVRITKQKRCAKREDKCLFPHYKVDERPNKKLKKSNYSQKKKRKATTRMLWLLWEVYHNWIATRKTRKHRFLKLENSLGEMLMQKVLEKKNQRVRFTKSTLCQASIRENEGSSVGKKSSSSAKSLRYEIWGPVPWRDWTTAAMCPKQDLESC